MKRWITLFALVILVQVGLTVYTHWNATVPQGIVTNGPLITIKSAEIDGLLFEDDQGKKLHIQKVNGQWLLPDSLNFPADSIRVQALIEKITQLNREWPEASTTEAASRFRVAADDYAHRLSLVVQGKTQQVLYFGTSPGLRKLYLRLEGDSEIHSMEIAAHDLAVDPGDWIDTTVLHLKEKQLAEVKLPEVVLKKGKEGLLPVGLKEGEEVNTKKLGSLVNRLTGLSISAILGTERKPEYGLDRPVLTYSVILQDGKTLTYSFAQKVQTTAEQEKTPPEDNSYILEVSSLKQLVQVDGWQVEAIKNAKREELVQMKAKAADEQESVQPPSNTVPH